MYSFWWMRCNGWFSLFTIPRCLYATRTRCPEVTWTKWLPFLAHICACWYFQHSSICIWRTGYSLPQIHVHQSTHYSPKNWPVASYTYNSGPVPNSDILTDHSMCLYNRKRHWDIDFCWQGLRKIRVLDPPRGAIYILPLACSLEASLHIYMSYFIFGEDKQIKHMIPAESYRRRNVKNAIDLAGQMLRFMFEILVVVLHW